MTTNNPDLSGATLEFWKEWADKSREFWSKMPSAGQPQDSSQVWREFFTLWSESWFKTFSQQATPDVFQSGQKLWTDQIEAWSQVFARVMNTESFSKLLGESLNRSLTWAQRGSDTLNPQIDNALWTMNLPSRSQIDRLLNRVIGLEEQLDDLEAQNRQLLKELKALSANAAARPEARQEAVAPKRGRRSKRV